MNSILLWIGSVLVIVLCALFAVPHFIDWTHYRGVFEEEASRVLGREVRVAGPVEVRLLPSPYVIFEKVRIADAAGSANASDNAPILKTERFRMGLAISPMLRGAFEANEIELDRPEINLTIAADGQGNWQSLASIAGNLPVAPREFGLDALRITNGMVLISGPDRQELARIDALDGDLSTTGANGPVRFRGAAMLNGERREIRLSTAPAEASALRIKAVVRGLQSGNSYQFDGKLGALAAVGRYDGELIVRLPVKVRPVANVPSSRSASTADQALELKAKVEGDVSGLKMSDLLIDFEHDGRPQQIAGEAVLSWFEGVDVKTALSTRWLDLDRVSGSAEGMAPLEGARWVIELIAAVIPAGGRFSGHLSADTVNLGKDVVSGLSMVIESRNGLLAVDDLQASLPGGGRIELAGRADSDGRFTGTLSLRAGNGGRLFGWATRGLGLPDSTVDLPTLLLSRFSIGTSSAELTGAQIELAGMPLTATLSHSWAGRPRTRIELTADRLDLSGELKGLLSARSARALVGLDRTKPSGAAGTPSTEIARWYDPTTSDLVLGIQAGLIQDGATRVRNVDAAMSLINGALNIERLQVATESDGRIEARGAIADIAAVARGSVTFTVAADSVAALEQILRLGELMPTAEVDLGAAADVLPMRLAGRVELGTRGTSKSEVTVDGGLRSTRVYFNSVLEQGLADWKSSQSDTHAVFVGPEVAALVDILLPGRRARIRDDRRPDDQLALHLAGVPGRGMLSVASLRSPGMEFAFDGRLRPGAEQGATANLSGRLTVRAGDLADMLARAGVTGLERSAPIPVVGSADVEFGNDRMNAVMAAMDVSGARVAGRVALVRQAGKVRIDASLKSPEASLQRMLAGLGTQNSTPVAKARSDLWPDVAFDLDRLKSLSGTLQLEADRLTLDSGLALDNASLQVEFGSSGLVVKDLSGAAFGGRLSSHWKLEPDRVDSLLSGDVALSDVGIEKSFGGTSTGRVSASMSVTSRGVGPRSLAQFATGKGEIRFTDAVVSGVDPGSVGITAERLIAADLDAEPGDVSATIRGLMKAGRVVVGSPRLELDMAGGAIKSAPLRIETPDAIVTNRTIFDLLTFDADSEWSVRPLGRQPAAGRSKEPLPGITVVYAGPIAAFSNGSVEPRLRVDDLARDITIRRMERAAEELERLRKLDEERAKQEAERRKAIEEAQAAQSLQLAPVLQAPFGSQPAGGTPGGSTQPLPPAPAGGFDPSAPRRLPPGRSGLGFTPGRFDDARP